MPTSREIIEASPDLKKLFDEGFEVSIKHVHLLISSVPYLDAQKAVVRGTLIYPLTLIGDIKAGPPPDHTAFWAGEYPHYGSGDSIKAMVANTNERKLAEGIVSKMQFSSMPAQADTDLYVKITRYADFLRDQARAIDPYADARTRRIVETDDEESSLVYRDTNSARAQILAISDKLKGQKVAIVGVGGTGSYILDFIAKTPVQEIHLFDDDEYSLHNSYRSPGAPTGDQLQARMSKVEYFGQLYSRFHKGIQQHPARITKDSCHQLNGFTFVFLSMDPGPEKKSIVDHLAASNIAFIDTGLGIARGDDNLVGAVSTTTVTPANKTFLPCVPVKPPGDKELYDSNIQIAELNALNAVMAVIRWKKHFGFYHNARNEHESTYMVPTNNLLNDQAKP